MAEVFGKSPEWADFTKQNIRRLVDEFSDGCAPSTLKTYLAMIKAVLNDAKDEHDIPCKKFDEELTVKNTPSVGVYLNLSDISKLESYKPANERENIVLAQFLCGCYTGARHSDILSMTEDNISGKYLTYVSQKTKIAATVEAKSNLKEMLAISSKKKYADSLFNQTIRDICKKAGVNEPVRVFRAGESISGKKYEFVASHTARRSFATNLAELGVPILQISKRMGHTDIKMTQHYIVSPIGALDERGMKYFE